MIADATGHGVPAALITAAAKSAVSLLKEDPELNIEKLVTGLNLALFETAKGEILMTAFILQIDPEGHVRSVNASHEAPAIVNSEGCEFVLTDSSPRLGESLESNFIVTPFSVPADSVLFLYTDGLTSQVNQNNREFGDKRLGKVLSKEISGSHQTLQKMNFSVFREIDEFKGAVAQNDDLTLVAIKLGAS
jgi:sigma-B regulation protein RsbU (phosphoserine phosphatase)